MIIMKPIPFLAAFAVAVTFGGTAEAAKLKALIVDGQNNHLVWPKATIMMKQYLEETGLFEVKVERTQYLWRAEREKDYLPLAQAGDGELLKEPKADPDFKPQFDQYDVVISNFGFNAADWPAETRAAFERYLREGGGFVSVHAADNSFGEWEEYNRMIGLGGWGGRNDKSGVYVYYNEAGKLVRDAGPGRVGFHGDHEPFPVTVRVKDHPITRGMPDVWMTAKDECYARLRGPAENMIVLATGKDLTERGASDRHEPVLMVIDYGKGRVFHTTLGHDDYSLEGVGFIVSFLRGVEWAATGKVTQPIPADFPTADKLSDRAFVLKTPLNQ